MSNDAAATSPAHFAIHTDDGAAPRQYDVAPGESIDATFASADVAMYGPAGFVRRISREDPGARDDLHSGRNDRTNENAGSKPAFSRSMA